MLRWFYVVVLAVLSVHVQAQATPKFSISGYVKDAADGESLMAASVYVVELGKGSTTNEYGFYSITLPQGKYTLRVTYVGYSNKEYTVDLNKDTRLNIELGTSAILTQEIVITGERKGENVESTDMGKQQISIEQSKAIPALLGEVDVLKTIQL